VRVRLFFFSWRGRPPEPPPPIARAALLLDIALLEEILQHPGNRLLGDLQDRQKMTHRLPGMAADEIERTMMRPAELVALELLVRFEGEVAVGIEHQLDALAQFLLAEKKRISGRFGIHHAATKVGFSRFS